MAFRIHIEINHKFEVNAPFKEVFDWLSDVPSAAVHYPGLDKIVNLGSGLYRWEMQKVGMGKLAAQIIYTCQYTADFDKGVINWVPATKGENTIVTGQFLLSGKPDSTLVELTIKSELSAPVPKLMKPAVEKIVRFENGKMTVQYINGLIDHFGGGRRLD